jgi:hypothetical protein
VSDTPKTDELAKREFVPDGLWIKHARELERENAALRKDKARLDFLSTLTGSGWACIHLDNKGTNDDWFLTRRQIDRRMATEPTQ